MKPQLLKVSKDLIHSFSARQDLAPNINNLWHYHPEIELVYFKQGYGTQFIGDNISQFFTGHVALIGPNLPHYWKFDDCFFNKSSNLNVEVCAVHFNKDFWGETFLQLPENTGINDTLQKSLRGIQITGDASLEIGALIEKLVYTEGTRKITLLLEVLLLIDECKQTEVLASLGFQHNFQESEKDRIHDIYNYSIANFKKKITLEEISAVAKVSSNSFCKYFKHKSRKTYSQFINEIRVSHACKLLVENELQVKEICYESGFYNFASFHQFFKKITGKSPLAYQKSFLERKKPYPD